MLLTQILHLAKDLDVEKVQKIVNYVKFFYSLKDDFSLTDFIKAVKHLKRAFNLDEDELLTTQLERITEYHRCGCPDTLEFEEIRDYNRWQPGMTLKWYIDSYVPGLSKDDQVAICSDVYKHISNIIDLRFERTTSSNSANLIIRAANRGNGLGNSGGTLAYAYLAPSRNFTGQLELVMDQAEIWVKNPTQRGIVFFNVFCHETLHNLGLSHSQVSSALMAPFYSPNVCCPTQNDDIPRLVNLYGKARESQPIPTPVPVPTPTPTPTPTPGGSEGAEIMIKGKVDKLVVDGWRCTRLD